MSAPAAAAVDFMPDEDLNRVGEVTFELANRIREEDPQELFRQLVTLCAEHPAKAAQMLMTFAAWFDPFEETEVLVGRARGVASRGRAVAV